MRLFLIAVILFILSVTKVFSKEVFSAAKNTFMFQMGHSYPFYGHWGDSEVGFGRAKNYKFMYIKEIDENISYGIQTGYSREYKNRTTNLNIRIFSFTPILFSWLGTTNRKYFVFVGSGIYHITQPKTAEYSSDSITEFGISMGTGVLYNFFFGLKWGLSLQWHHIFNMEANNFKLESANNFDIVVNFAKRF